MPLTSWFSITLVLSLIGLLALTSLPADMILLGGLTVFIVTGIISPESALSGFSNEGMITVAVLFIVVAGIRETGGISYIANRLLGTPKSLINAQIRVMLPTLGVSAFLNNTPVVAMLIPAIHEWAKKNKFPVSKLMIPLSYAAIFGGTCTLIGTSTNLIVNGMMMSHDELNGFGMFDIAWVGVPCAIVGFLYMLFIGQRLLPNRFPPIQASDDPREYTVEMMVEPGSSLIGLSIEKAGLRNLPSTFLVEITRGTQVLPAVSPQEILQENDRLVFAGIVESVVDLQKIRGLSPATEQVFKLDAPRSERCLIETVVSNTCPLIGKTIRAGGFRSRYNAVIIAVARNGERINKKIGDIVLHTGDTLLLETHPSFFDQQRNSSDFYLISRVENSNPLRHEKAYTALAILIGMVILASTGLLSMLQATLLAAGAMLLTSCCNSSTARNSIDWSLLLVIGASLGIGAGLEETQTASYIANGLITLAGDHPYVLLIVVYFVTMLFTEMITNNAAAVIMFEIAYASATNLGVDFQPYAIAIMMAASASFSTPIGYQTNLMVYGPGGYQFRDYLKVGIPLNMLMAATALLIIPWIWNLA